MSTLRRGDKALWGPLSFTLPHQKVAIKPVTAQTPRLPVSVDLEATSKAAVVLTKQQASVRKPLIRSRRPETARAASNHRAHRQHRPTQRERERPLQWSINATANDNTHAHTKKLSLRDALAYWRGLAKKLQHNNTQLMQANKDNDLVLLEMDVLRRIHVDARTQKDYESLAQSHAEYVGKAADFAQENYTLGREQQRMSSELKSALMEVASMSRDKERARSELDTLAKQHRILNAHAKETDEQFLALTDRETQIRTAHSLLIRQTKDQMAHVAALKEEDSKRTAVLNDMTESFTELQRRNKQWESEIESNRASFKVKCDQLDTALATIKDLKHSVILLSNELLQKKQENHAYTLQIEALYTEAKSLKTRLSTRAHEQVLLHDRISKYEEMSVQQTEKYQNDTEALTKETSRLRDAVAAHVQKHSEHQEHIAVAQRSVRERNSVLHMASVGLNAQLAALKQQVLELTSKGDEKNEQLVTLRTKVDGLQTTEKEQAVRIAELTKQQEEAAAALLSAKADASAVSKPPLDYPSSSSPSAAPIAEATDAATSASDGKEEARAQSAGSSIGDERTPPSSSFSRPDAAAAAAAAAATADNAYKAHIARLQEQIKQYSASEESGQMERSKIRAGLRNAKEQLVQAEKEASRHAAKADELRLQLTTRRDEVASLKVDRDEAVATAAAAVDHSTYLKAQKLVTEQKNEELETSLGDAKKKHRLELQSKNSKLSERKKEVAHLGKQLSEARLALRTEQQAGRTQREQIEKLQAQLKAAAAAMEETQRSTRGKFSRDG